MHQKLIDQQNVHMQLHQKLLEQQEQHLREIAQKNKTITTMEESIIEKDKQIRELQSLNAFIGSKTTKGDIIV